ncbi:MAG: hypothetical protein U0529_14540 [Thermoanaerobaculia bacterium]
MKTAEPMTHWPFPEPPDSAAVTTSYVTDDRMPIVHVSRDLDEDGETTWQFHAEPDFSMSAARLVRLATIVALDPTVLELASLPLGATAIRASLHAPWVVRTA